MKPTAKQFRQHVVRVQNNTGTDSGCQILLAITLSPDRNLSGFAGKGLTCRESQ
jgi:hypothetical protein